MRESDDFRCSNCGDWFTRHCKVHVIPCCPGKCPGLEQNRWNPFAPEKAGKRALKAIDIKHAEVGTVTSRVDGAVSFRVITPELTLEQRATVLGLHGKNVRIMVEPIDVPVEGVDEVESEAEPKSKSKCARLRAVLYVLYKQDAARSKECTFDTYYNAKMEALIDKIKDKLDSQ